jgi:hypothetical protein
MAKLTKHAEVLNQLHSMVKKQAEEAQKNVSGAPGQDVKSHSVGDDHESHNKNSIGPENQAQGYHQKPSDDASEPLAGAKTAEELGTEILNIIRKQADAQSAVTGKPATVNPTSVGDDQEKVDKNAVKPENNKQDYEQKASTDESKPLAGAKKAEVEDLAAKVASYELGRQFCAALLKTAGEQYVPNQEVELMKEAGRRDFDLLIAQAAEDLESSEKQAEDYYFEKEAAEAEQAGAEYFDAVIKQAALEEAVAENQKLAATLAEYEAFFKAAQEEEHIAASQAKLAESVAATVLAQLKAELAPSTNN